MPHHPLLNNYDVLAEVFRYFDPYPDSSLKVDKRSRKTLAQSARVCKTFANPALDLLWKTLETFEPLLKVLNIHGTCCFGRSDPSTTELDRLRQYTLRIRKIKHCSELGHLYHYVLFTLSDRYGWNPSLPGLVSLSWDQLTAFDPSLSMLASPSLRELHIAFPSGTFAFIRYVADGHQQDPIGGLLHAVFSRTPYLQKLSISGYMHSSPLSSILGLRHLRKIALKAPSYPVDWSTFCALSAMENLVDLTTPIEFNEGYHETTPGATFSVLCRVELEGTILDLSRALMLITSTNLESLKICARITFADSMSDFHNLVGTLKRLDWTSSYAVVLDVVTFQIPAIHEQIATLIRPFLHFDNLTYLSVRTQARPLLWDEDLLEMAKAWPQLESLEVAPKTSDCTYGILPSFDTIIKVTRRCSKLQSLRVPFSIDIQALVSQEMQLRDAFPHSLRFLDLGLLWFDLTEFAKSKPMVIARIMDRLFPNLDIETCRKSIGNLDSFGIFDPLVSQRQWTSIMLAYIQDDRGRRAATIGIP
ncbi:hypothetical protein B0H21DRAFT_220340 [Amylocystis lapponica]|nr:hypothetical protein B0H21DRAFT_220340 [Amylocystis lapponica]